MPVVTIAQSKGGAGKTTLALALASEFDALGGTVHMLDADRQNSLMNWHRDREASGKGEGSRIVVEDASQLRDADIGNAIANARSRAQLIIVDSEGTSNFKTAYAAMDSDYVVIPTRSSRLDLERTVETSDMLERMCRGVAYRVLITQTGQVARSKAEWEIDAQIARALPTFPDQMHTLDAYRAMSNFRLTLAEVEAAGLARTDKARRIAQAILAQILSEIQTGERRNA
ncbi:ParA family protein [Novosphingobium taihuense]|uniref:ParA family protein n=1 Tax=Novosphingobium taihuense TaxID=260085 RepID=UPI001199C80D|nr:ParA family protein [Novosphingobium taihuense]TWH78537.1 chromosome partitioning protein [Novosphingobium taihuense]